jgi:predicted lipid-binding transport protein (Tim44 family)
MGSAGFPIDLILFGMIAAFLVLRLRSILGRRDGLEPSQSAPRPGMRAGPVIDAKAEPAAAVAPRPAPDPTSPVGRTLDQMRQVDRDFDTQRFLGGAEAAFRLIVTEFAAGHRDALRPLLSDETYTAFEGVITAREAGGEVQTTEIRSLHEITIQDAALRGNTGDVTVLFVSDQVSQLVDREGKYISGTDAVTELRDLWTFERDLSGSDPAWRLTQARSA